MAKPGGAWSGAASRACGGRSKREMGGGGRMGRPGLCGTEAGRAEQSRVLGVQLVQVYAEQRTRGRAGLATALPTGGTGPPGFPQSFGRWNLSARRYTSDQNPSYQRASVRASARRPPFTLGEMAIMHARMQRSV